MSYRALVTIINCDEMDYRDYIILMREDWSEGEKLAHDFGRNKTFDLARNWINMGGCVEASPRQFDTKDDRDAWADTYADQTWTVEFTEDGDYTKVEITGKDAGGTMVFYRSTVYG